MRLAMSSTAMCVSLCMVVHLSSPGRTTLRNSLGEVTWIYGRPSRVSRLQLRARPTITGITDAGRADARRARRTARRALAQRAELGDWHFLPQNPAVAAPDRRPPGPPCLYPR